MQRDFVGIFQKPSEEFWLTKAIPSAPKLLSGVFYKVGRLLQQPTPRTYSFSDGLLFYGKDAKDIKGYCDVWLTYISFHVVTNQHWISIQKGNQVHSIYTLQEPTYQLFKQALSRYCIQTTYEKDLKVKQQLGKGSFSTVHLAIGCFPPQEYALKVFEKLSLKNSMKLRVSIENEAKAIMAVNHPNILKLYQIYEGPQHVYLVTQYASGGSLFKRFQQLKRMSLKSIKLLIVNLLSALVCLHSIGIMHRDIKPSNIMYLDPLTETDVLIIDMGFATSTKTMSSNYVRCGSPGYVAPEILQYMDGSKPYNEKCDVFSLGVTIFLILYGFHPLRSTDTRTTLKRNFEGKIQFTKNEQIGEMGEDFVKRMVKPNPRERISSHEALKHPFLILSAEDAVTFIDLPANAITLEDHQSRQLIKQQTFQKEKITQDSNDSEPNRKSAFSVHRKSMLQQPQFTNQSQQNPILEDSFYASESSSDLGFAPVRQIQVHQTQSPFEKYRSEKSFH